MQEAAEKTGCSKHIWSSAPFSNEQINTANPYCYVQIRRKPVAALLCRRHKEEDALCLRLSHSEHISPAAQVLFEQIEVPCRRRWSLLTDNELIFLFDIRTTQKWTLRRVDRSSNARRAATLNQCLLSTRQRNLGGTHKKPPHWCNTMSSPHRQARDSVLCGAAAVTYLISDERRANINNVIKQKINWQRAANC